METHAVREIVPLPEIIPLDETPDYIAGVANLRGQIVTVIDLNLRFGHPTHRYDVEDCIVFLERAGSIIGIVVNNVESVIDIAPGEMVPMSSYGTEAQPDSQFLTGLFKSGEQVVMLLHLENLLDISQSMMARHDLGGIVPPNVQCAVFPDVTPQERSVFRERAHSLAQPLERLDQTGLLPHAVVRLGEELFGIELHTIREFANLRTVTPVPCCPNHIVGQMNLRGNLITLLDVTEPLGLSPTRGRSDSNVVVVNATELDVGVLVDQVLGVCYLHPEDVSCASARTPVKEYLHGTAPHGSRMMSLLDLRALLTNDGLIVNEKP